MDLAWAEWGHGGMHPHIPPFGYHYTSLRDKPMIVEHGTQTRGSCCDRGRYEFADCKNWWYFCKAWGVSDVPTWLQFGTDTFTFATITEHGGTCTYHPHKTLCPLSPSPALPSSSAAAVTNTEEEEKCIECENAAECTVKSSKADLQNPAPIIRKSNFAWQAPCNEYPRVERRGDWPKE